jgi:hypothetical protein
MVIAFDLPTCELFQSDVSGIEENSKLKTCKKMKAD